MPETPLCVAHSWHSYGTVTQGGPMVKMVTCVIVGPNLDLVPVHEMTLEQAREAVETLAADLRRLNRCNEMDREVREIIAESRERRRRSFWG